MRPQPGTPSTYLLQHLTTQQQASFNVDQISPVMGRPDSPEQQAPHDGGSDAPGSDADEEPTPDPDEKSTSRSAGEHPLSDVIRIVII